MAKSSVEIRNVDKALRAVEGLFNSTIKRDRLLARIRDFAVDRIRAETQKGKDLSRGGRPQPELSEFTKIVRANIQSGKWLMTPNRSPLFRFNLSQLTLTGQLLESLVGRIRANLSSIEVTVEGKRQPIRLVVAKSGKEIKFRNRDEIATNKGLARSLAERSRTFLGLDKKGVIRIRRMVLDEFRRNLRRSRFIAKP